MGTASEFAPVPSHTYFSHLYRTAMFGPCGSPPVSYLFLYKTNVLLLCVCRHGSLLLIKWLSFSKALIHNLRLIQ